MWSLRECKSPAIEASVDPNDDRVACPGPACFEGLLHGLLKTVVVYPTRNVRRAESEFLRGPEADPCDDAHQQMAPFHQLWMMMAVSQGHPGFVTRLRPPREATNSSSVRSSSLKDSSCHKIASHSSSSETCWTNVLKPLKTLCTFQDTTQSSCFSQRWRWLSADSQFLNSSHPVRDTLQEEQFPQCHTHALEPLGVHPVLIRVFVQDLAAPRTQHVRIRVRSGLVQKGLGFEHVTQRDFPAWRELNGDSELFASHLEHVRFNSSNQCLLHSTARVPATTILDPKRDPIVCCERHRPPRCFANKVANKRPTHL